MKLKEYLSQDELQILDEELFCDIYQAILDNKWSYLDGITRQKLCQLSPLDLQQAAIRITDDYLAYLPEWSLSEYFARYGSQYLSQIRKQSLQY